MDCINNDGKPGGHGMSAKAAKELYHRIWDTFNARWWSEYFDLNNRTDWGAPFIPSDTQIEGMLHTALLYTGAARDCPESKIVSQRVFTEAILLVRHGCPYSSEMVSLLLLLSTDSFFLEFQDPFEITPCWFYLEPKFFITVMGMIKEEFLRDKDFARVMVSFLETLKERFAAEWIQRQKDQWGPPIAFPEERYGAELKELLDRAEALLQKSGQEEKAL
ncbi:hypothetical protein AGMMS49983_10140 [Clostridia bacterium]|nr:hypothetical protein AGMMS49983_10140 [Clostridia bacterium]